MYKFFFKRFLDIILSFICLIILIPVLITVSVLLSIVNRGNPFFIQSRAGKSEKIFKLIKFKTMNDLCDSNGILLPEIQRITPIGEVIRKTSIDELPQLINVLKGDMSIIGPRPLLIEYLPLYDAEQKRRHEVRPGITGWAQINGRNAISWKDKFTLDVWYVDNLSFGLDMKIIILTMLKVIKREGINRSSFVTMEKFNGNN